MIYCHQNVAMHASSYDNVGDHQLKYKVIPVEDI